jgi:EmrB/QacA subfamily drug resistance transporter
MEGVSDKAKWGTLISCSLSCFIVWLDFAIVNTALPAIEKDLSASILQLQWVINAYIFSLAVLIVTLGRISDHIGRRRMNIWGVFFFGLFSLLAALAHSPQWLIFCRVMQGAASAAIIPSSLALISHAFPGKEKGKAIGIWSGVTGLGMAAGPVLGGFLVSALSWQWIFYINVPISILSIFCSFLFAKESRLASEFQRPDLKGSCLLTFGLGALVFGLMHGPDWGWLDVKTLLLFVAALLLLTWFFRAERRCECPTIPFALFSSCAFFCSTLVMFGLVFVFTSALFLIPLYLIQVRGQEAYQAGLTILPITACIAFFSPFVGHLMSKVSTKTLMILGLIVFLSSTILQTSFSTETSYPFLLLSFILLGLGWSIARTPATSTALGSVPSHFAGTATGVLWTIQNSGGALSVAITLTLFRTIFEASSTPASFLAGYHASMWLLSAVTLSVILTLAFYMRSK